MGYKAGQYRQDKARHTSEISFTILDHISDEVLDKTIQTVQGKTIKHGTR